MNKGIEFVNEIVGKLMDKFQVKHHYSTSYKSQTNELVKWFNKSLCNLLAKLMNESAE